MVGGAPRETGDATGDATGDDTGEMPRGDTRNDTGADAEASARDDPAPFRDAEEWLNEQGIERRPITVDPSSERTSDGAGRSRGADGGAPPPAPPPPEEPPGTPAEDQHRSGGGDVRGQTADSGASAEAPRGPRVSDTEGTSPDGASRQSDVGAAGATRGESRGRLEDEVAEAVAFARRSTATSPQSEGRLAGKMAERGYSQVVVDQALERCREQGIVDDGALAASFVDERLRKGHGRSRIGRDLRKRGFDSATIEQALSALDSCDEEAAALEIAVERAEQMSDEDAETVFRRLVGYLARRGYAEGLSRKVARKAVFDH